MAQNYQHEPSSHLWSIDCGENVEGTLGSERINRIHQQLARQAELDSDLMARITGHSFQAMAAKD